MTRRVMRTQGLILVRYKVAEAQAPQSPAQEQQQLSASHEHGEAFSKTPGRSQHEEKGKNDRHAQSQPKSRDRNGETRKEAEEPIVIVHARNAGSHATKLEDVAMQRATPHKTKESQESRNTQ